MFEKELVNIGNLEGLPRPVFIDKKCRNLKVYIYGDPTRNIRQKRFRRLIRLYKSIPLQIV